jgi:hypothetical protein
LQHELLDVFSIISSLFSVLVLIVVVVVELRVELTVDFTIGRHIGEVFLAKQTNANATSFSLAHSLC